MPRVSSARELKPLRLSMADGGCTHDVIECKAAALFGHQLPASVCGVWVFAVALFGSRGLLA